MIVPVHHAKRCVISMRPDPLSIGSVAAILLVTSVAADVITLPHILDLLYQRHRKNRGPKRPRRSGYFCFASSGSFFLTFSTFGMATFTTYGFLGFRLQKFWWCSSAG